jgi:hypothetical protein
MAEFAEMGDPAQLYMAIEKAYCEDRWPDVLDQGQKLLSRLPGDDLGLRQRLQLLLAHTYLYGFGNRDSAGELYRAVQESQAESALRQIAAQGLQQCGLPPTPPATPLAEPPHTPQRETEAVVTPVMPWLASPQATGDAPGEAAFPAAGEAGAPASLIPEVIDEKELIEVHQANPALAEELELRELPSGGGAARALGGLALEPDLALENDPTVGEELEFDEDLDDDLGLDDDLDLEDDPELLNGLLKVELF